MGVLPEAAASAAPYVPVANQETGMKRQATAEKVLETTTLVEEGQAFIELAARPGPSAVPAPERFRVIVIGGGQAGLSVGYHLARRGVPFIVLDAQQRVGDVWRRRWDSLRLFSPARFDGLDGMPFPAPPHSFPTKDQMADYLVAYAARFQIPVRTGVKVDGLTRQGDRFLVTSGAARYEADQVVVAMANYQQPRLPAFAPELDPRIVQLHAVDYRNPSQLRRGGVLIAGAGNSGSEIGLELARHGHRIWMSGRDVGHIPFRVESLAARLLLPFLFRGVFHRLLTVRTRPGRKAKAKALSQGALLIRNKPKDLTAAGIERVPRVVGVQDGMPVLEDGRALDVANVVWCTGFHPGFSWIDLPVFDEHGEPRQVRGVVEGEPGLYFVGLHFLYAMSSTMIHGVGRDARYVAEHIASRSRALAL
jgi:putative flavoprotein involved in K+ transport